MAKIDQDHLLAIIEEIYLAGSGESTWEDVLNVFQSKLPEQRPFIVGMDEQSGLGPVFVGSRWEKTYVQSYADHYVHLNPWTEKMRWMPEAPIITHSEEVLPYRELRKTEFYNDWLRPQEDVSNAYGTVLFRESDRFFIFSSHYNPRYQEESAHVSDIMRLVAPHIRRGMELTRQLGSLKLLLGSLEAVLDQLDTAVFLLDHRLELAFANGRAEALLAEARMVRRHRNKKLGFTARADDEAVRAAITQARAGSGVAGQLFVQLQTPPASPYVAFVSPVARERYEPTMQSGHRSQPPQHILLFLIDPRELPRAREDMVRSALGVTPAEARLAVSLLKGRTIQQHAEMFEITQNTARVQMKGLLYKCGVNRQADLMRVLMKTVGMLDLEQLR